MAYIPQALNGHYVKFIRGTPTAWEHFAVKDKDTLYFIAEEGKLTGKLYLGDVLIAGSDNIISSMSDLIDIETSSPIYNNSLLVYDSDSGKWKNQPLGVVLSELENITVEVMKGASESTDGEMGLVPAPLKDQQNLFLRGDATWANPVAGIDTALAALSGRLDDLYDDTNNTNSIRNIAQAEVATIVGAAPEDFDTLKEIADWISRHEDVSDISKFDARVTTVENTLFGTEEKRDDSDNVIEAATPGLVSIVSNLNDLINNEDTGLISRVETIEKTIDESLIWGQLVEEK